MTLHHLDCCTMCPLGRRFINNQQHLVGHVLALETAAGDVVLVDTGIGTLAMAEPQRLMGRQFTTVFRPNRDPARTALRQLEALGHAPADVRHIVLTHLDIDHAGGLRDFPTATVHVSARELAAVRDRGTFNERQRYRPILWEDGTQWAPFGNEADGDDWFGFTGTRLLPDMADELIAIPFSGHTRGHTAFALRNGDRWLLHTGDAYFHTGTIHPHLGPPSRYLRIFERGVAVNRRAVKENHVRLTELAAGHPDVTVFCAHDPVEFARLCAGQQI